MTKCKRLHQIKKIYKYIVVGKIKNAEEMRLLSHFDLCFFLLQNVRRSPAFFNNVLYDHLKWLDDLKFGDMKWKKTIQEKLHNVTRNCQMRKKQTWLWKAK